MFTRNPALREYTKSKRGSILSTWRAESGRAAWVPAAIDALKEFAGVDRVGVWLEPDAQTEDRVNPVVFRGEVWGREDENLPGEWARASVGGLLAEEMLNRGQPVEYQNRDEQPERLVGPLVGLQYAVWVPVNGQKLLRGLILVGTREKHVELPKVQAEFVAAELAVLLELEEQARISNRRQGDLGLWQHIQSSLVTDSDIQVRLQELVESCTEDESRGGVGLIFALIGELQTDLSAEREGAMAGGEGRLVVRAQSGDAAWAHSVEQGPLESLWVQAVESGRMMCADADRLPLAKDISRIVSIPLQSRGETVGMLMAGLPKRSDSLEFLDRLEMRATLARQLLEVQHRAVEQRRQELWQQAVLDSSSETVLLIDARGFVRGLSQVAREFLRQRGMLEREFAVKNRFAELFRPLDWEKVHGWVMSSFAKVNEESKETMQAELRPGTVVELHRVAHSEREFLAVRMEAVEAVPHTRRIEDVEAELYQTLEWLEEGVLIVDECGVIRSMNTRCQQMLGLSCKQVVGLRSLEELIAVASQNAVNPEEFAKNWRMLSAKNEVETQEELAMDLPTPQVIERCTRPLVDKQGKNRGRVEVYQEVTARRMFQSRMLQAEKLASLGQRALGIVHELSNPLTTILGNAQQLMLHNSSTKESTELGRILQEAERASNILRQLLHLSRENSPLRRPVHLDELVERTVELQKQSLRGEQD